MLATSKSFTKLPLHGELGRFLRFLVVGFSSTAVDFGVLASLKHFAGWDTLSANVVSYSCGIVTSYLLSYFWLYRQGGQRQSLAQIGQYVAVSLVGLVLNNVLVLALEGPIGQLISNPAAGYLPAKVMASMLVMLWNFSANRWWTFGKAVKQTLQATAAKHTEVEFYERRAA